ncbi:hypothetical protein H0H92_015670 [Tricholoma furcatifolium]|nr:hypothetical protein H0H92_015670 [Tricholoma furcatifolium]
MLSTKPTSRLETSSGIQALSNKNKDKKEDDTSFQRPVAHLVRTFVRTTGDPGVAKGTGVIRQTSEEAIITYTESAQMALDALDAIGKIHPVIGGEPCWLLHILLDLHGCAATVLAFKLVVTLDLKRRQNDAKVTAVMVQMLSMMSVLNDLGNVKDPDDIGSDGQALSGRLQILMYETEECINECASMCDLYMKKSLIKKYIKSWAYENRLAQFANRFSEFEAKLQQALTMHMVRGINAIAGKLNEQGNMLSDIQFQMRELFLRLDMPREKEIRSMIQDRGGAKLCIGNDKDLQALIEKLSEDSLDLVGPRDLGKSRKTLLKELAEDVETALQQNFALFNGKMGILQDAITMQIRQG